MTKTRSLVYLLIFLAILLIIRFWIFEKLNIPQTRGTEIWFASGLLLVILGVFLTERYFTKTIDVIVNVITLLVALWAVDRFETFILYPALLIYVSSVGIMAFLSFLLTDEQSDSERFVQRIATGLYRISTFFGSARLLFSIVFLLSFFNYFIITFQKQGGISNQEVAAIIVILFWGFVLLVEPIDRHLIKPLSDTLSTKKISKLIGDAISRQGSGTITIREDNSIGNSIEVGDIVLLSERVKTVSLGQKSIGLISDISISEQSRFLEITPLTKKSKSLDKLKYAFVISEDEAKTISIDFVNDYRFIKRDDILGVVIDHSDIDVVRIKMHEGVDAARNLKEGDLVEIEVYGNSVKYQIINAETESFGIEGKSKQGTKIITAQQIGTWDATHQQFIDASWVPDNREIAFLEPATDKPLPEKGEGFYRVGTIPTSRYPIYIDFKEAISHHVAIIGKTGTGKSFMAARILEQMARCGYKVIILEVDQNNPQSLSNYIDKNVLSDHECKWSYEEKNRKVKGKNEKYTDWKCELDLSATNFKCNS
jgi:uncharacterized protein